MTLLPSSLFAQGSAKAIDFEDLSVSYIYAAVMGTGTYKIEDRRISMLRIPFSYIAEIHTSGFSNERPTPGFTIGVNSSFPNGVSTRMPMAAKLT